MKTNRFTIGIVAAAAVIATLFFTWQQRRLAQADAEVQHLRSEIAPLPDMRHKLARLQQTQVDQAELIRLRERDAAAQRELPKLRGQAAQARRAEADAVRSRNELEHQAAQASDGSNRLGAPMAELMHSSVERTLQRRLARMQERLNLSPAQSQGIQEILSRKARVLGEAMKGAFSGNIDREKIAAAREGHGDSELEIQALLSPEQQTAYAAFVDEEKTEAASLAANSELLQMQHTLGLKDHQADAVFGILYDHSLQRNKGASGANEPANPVEAMQKEVEAMQKEVAAKLQALEPVLTPEQLAGYREQQELQLKFVKNMFGKLETSPARP